MRWLAASTILGLCLMLTIGCGIRHAQAQGGRVSISEARRIGLPEQVGSWKLVRYVPGKDAHFLYAQNRRSFSLFVTRLDREGALQARKGWTPIRLPGGDVAYLHVDPRDSARAAIAWKRGSQRRILIGRMPKSELQTLAAKL